MILLTATINLLRRVSVEKIGKVTCFQSFRKIAQYAFTFPQVQYLLHRSIVSLLVPVNEATSIDTFPFTYIEYHNKVSCRVSFRYQFAAIRKVV